MSDPVITIKRSEFEAALQEAILDYAENCQKHDADHLVKLNAENERLNSQLMSYRKCVNKIDDYFEYSHESAVDKKKVMGIIGELTKELRA